MRICVLTNWKFHEKKQTAAQPRLITCRDWREAADDLGSPLLQLSHGASSLHFCLAPSKASDLHLKEQGPCPTLPPPLALQSPLQCFIAPTAQQNTGSAEHDFQSEFSSLQLPSTGVSAAFPRGKQLSHSTDGTEPKCILGCLGFACFSCSQVFSELFFS